MRFFCLLDFRFLFAYNLYMHEKINESIEVLVKFKINKVVPSLFKWRGKVYKIEKINMIHKERDGNDKICYFSVSDKVNFFRLAFFTRNLSWRIEELYFDG